VGVLWHPLTDDRSVEAWWSLDTLATDAAATGFVSSELALAHEPQPVDLQLLIAA
jgi:hypothetical protein